MAKEDTTREGVSGEEAKTPAPDSPEDKSAEAAEQEQPDGTEQEAPKEEEPKFSSPHAARMAELNEKRKQQLKENDHVDFGDEPDDGGEEGDPAEGDDTAKEEGGEDRPRDDKGRFAKKEEGAETLPDGKKPDAGAKDGERLITVKVYGEEKQVPLSEVVAGYQTTSAGQAALREANRLKKEVEQERQRLQEQQTQNRAQEDTVGPAPTGQQQGAKPATSDDEALEIARKLQYGDEKDVAEVVKNLLNQGRGSQEGTTTQDLEALLQRATQTATQQATDSVRYEATVRHALETFGAEFPPEYATDDGLKRITADAIHAIRKHDLEQIGYDMSQIKSFGDLAKAHYAAQQKGLVRSETELFRAGGQYTRAKIADWLGRFTPQDAPVTPEAQPQTDAFDQKREVKRQTPAPPRAATKRVATDTTYRPKSGTGGRDTLEWLREKRGRTI